MNESNELKIYIAGPGVFLPNAKEHGTNLKEICKKYGFIGIYPLDNDVSFTRNTQKKQIARMIKVGNTNFIKEADIIVADLNSFRGFEMDSGTAYEIGYADALNKKIFGFMTDTRSIIEKYPNAKKNKENVIVDEKGFSIEDFELPINLMIGVCATIIKGDFEDCIEYISRNNV